MAVKSMVFSNLIQPFTYFSLSSILTINRPRFKCLIQKNHYARHFSVQKNAITKTMISNNHLHSLEGIDQSKTQLILKLNFESPDDILPFYKLPIRTLIHIHKITLNDEKNGFCKNRLYYLANRIKCPPAVLSAYVAKRTFIYSLSFQWLENSLDVLLGKFLYYTGCPTAMPHEGKVLEILKIFAGIFQTKEDLIS